MRFRKPVVEELELNLTPMIDCLLFLLVFLLLSTTFSNTSQLNIVLPEAQGTQIETPNETIEVAVEASGQFSVNGVPLSANSEAELIAAVKRAAGNKRDQLYVVSADAKAQHQSVVIAMDVAGQLGFINLNISTVMP